MIPSLALALLLPLVPPPAGDGDDVSTDPPALRALRAELGRSFEGLRNAEADPLYFLAYRATETRRRTIRAYYGALMTDEGGRSRQLDIEARVGSPHLDSTHQIRGELERGPSPESTRLPLEDDADAIRAKAWEATDAAYKAAQERFLKVKTNEQVKVEAEDTSDDFAPAEPADYRERPVTLELDDELWRDRLRRAAEILREYPYVHDGEVQLEASAENRLYVNTEGTTLVFGRTAFRIMIQADTKADDGMDLELYESFEAPNEDALPDQETLAGAVREVARRLGELREAPIVEPWSGPAIIMNRACGVFFHEIFGHRIEGHRQKNVEEGQTFKKKVGTEILPPFLSVYDDPTLERFGQTYLNGHYLYDDEGVPAERVMLVERGVLRGFLMSRSPIEGFPRSNGHGRCQTGYWPVSRQGNLIVEAHETVPFERLREMLIEEIRRQDKPYGYIFHDISGGFTTTQRSGPQAFKVIPLYVVRVYPDGRPDEVVRGVDLVGTPLTSLSKILAAADDPAVFNGMCGAESGWVPVSAVAPSVLVQEIEIEKKRKSQERPPILPPPLYDEGADGGAEKKEVR